MTINTTQYLRQSWLRRAFRNEADWFNQASRRAGDADEVEHRHLLFWDLHSGANAIFPSGVDVLRLAESP